MAAKVGDKWYRFEDIQYAAPLDEYDQPCGAGRLVVSVQEFFVIKVTPCGVRLHTGRFVRFSTKKQFACPSEKEAKASFLARKACQAAIYRARMGASL